MSLSAPQDEGNSLVSFGDHARVRKIDIADEIDVWFSPEPNQGSLFPSEIQLTDKYFDVLSEHAMGLRGTPYILQIYYSYR